MKKSDFEHRRPDKKSMPCRQTKRGSGSLKIVLGIFLLLLGGVAVAASALFRFDEWHGFDPAKILECDRSTLITSDDGSLICAAGDTRRICIGLDELSKTTIDAFIAAEDQRFYSHDGIDLYRIFGAAWADIKAGGYVQGASTISQQLIKLSHLSTEKTIDRKLEEAVLALRLEAGFSKDEIMEMYLNYVYFGGGYYGIEAASLGYFGVHSAELTAAQAAQLAGILKSPSAYAPHIDMEASLSRRATVLRLMHENGFLNDEEYEEASAEGCVLSPAFPNRQSAFIDYAINEACGILGIERTELLKSGYVIRTTLDSGIQEECEALMADDAAFPSENAQGAVVVLKNDGGIAAMCGSRGGGEYASGSLNRAADIERQPGSLIKPILVYAPALQQYGYTAATVLRDEPMDFGGYSPRNSDDKYYGAVTLRQAVTRSLNVPAVAVLADVGLPNAVMFAERMGVSFDNEEPGLAMALGGFTHGVSPLEMAGAYLTIADGGVRIKPCSVERIEDAEGRILYERTLHGERVLSCENAFILTSMLQSVAAEGTGKRLAETGLSLAAKTGTAVGGSGVRDAWCAAYSPEYTAVAWMGTDRAEDGSLPDEAVGGNHTAVLLGRVFTTIYAERPFPEFEKPDGVEECAIDLSETERGRISLAADFEPEEYRQKEYFLPGTEPQDINTYWVLPKPPVELGWSIGADGKPVISFCAESRDLTYVVKRISEGGNTEVIAELNGRLGYQSCTDTAAESGSRYRYVVTSYHPEITQNGTPLESEPSRELIVSVP